MAHPREGLTARLVEIAAGIDGVQTVARNIRRWADGTTFPGIAVQEGSQFAAEDDKTAVRTVMVPRRVRWLPNLTIAAGDVPEDIGTVLNTLEGRVIKAVLSDEQLLSMTINSLGVKYMGTEYNLDQGRQMVGQYAVNFQISYWLNPAEL